MSWPPSGSVSPATVPPTLPLIPKKFPKLLRSPGTAALRPASKDTTGPAPAAHSPPPAIESVSAGSATVLPGSDPGPRPAPASSHQTPPPVPPAVVPPPAVSKPGCAPPEIPTREDSLVTFLAASVGTTAGTIPEQSLPHHAPATPTPADNAKAAPAALRIIPPPQPQEQSVPTNVRQPAVKAAVRGRNRKKTAKLCTCASGMRERAQA